MHRASLCLALRAYSTVLLDYVPVLLTHGAFAHERRYTFRLHDALHTADRTWLRNLALRTTSLRPLHSARRAVTRAALVDYPLVLGVSHFCLAPAQDANPAVE